MSTIISIGTATPDYQHRQRDIMDFMLETLNPDEKTRKLLHVLYQRSGIDNRYSVLPDFSVEAANRSFFKSNSPSPSIDERMTIYTPKALDLSLKAIKNCLGSTDISEITHLITVTCTGLSAPGLDILLLQALALRPTIVRTSVNFMGCYAAIHGLKLADAFCKSTPNAKVLVVCTELCTLHFQQANDLDALLSSTLFADGSAACLVTSEPAKEGLTIHQFSSLVALQGKTDMAWNLSSTGFLMSLTNHVPQLVKAKIQELLQNALVDLKLTQDEVVHWAIHPGGKNIVEAAQQALALPEASLTPAYDVLRKFGNMSSPTILFVLKTIMEKAKTNEPIFGVAFGPGITMESIVLSKS